MEQEGLAVARIERDDPSSSTKNPGIIPSDDPGEALSVSSKDIHLSKHAKISGIHCTLPQCTNVTDRQTDRQTDTGIIA